MVLNITLLAWCIFGQRGLIDLQSELIMNQKRMINYYYDLAQGLLQKEEQTLRGDKDEKTSV